MPGDEAVGGAPVDALLLPTTNAIALLFPDGTTGFSLRLASPPGLHGLPAVPLAVVLRLALRWTWSDQSVLISSLSWGFQ